MVAAFAMHEGLFVYRTAGHTLVGVRRNNAWQAFRAAADADEGAVGNVYRGRIIRVVPGMSAAFVDVGQARPAFLHFDDAPPAPPPGPGRPSPVPLQLHQRLLVQVKKEPLGDKGARITGQLALSGRYVVYLPAARHVAVSQRIVDLERRAALQALLQPALGAAGAVARTAAEHADDADVLRELAALQARHEALCARFAEGHKASLLSVEHTAALQRCLSLCAQQPWEAPALWGNDEAFLHKLADALREHGRTPEVHGGPEVLFARKQSDRLGFFAGVTEALKRQVPLPSGGALAVDECEAMAVVDVNSGKFVGKRAVAETLHALNVEAAAEVARQLQLRALGGIVAVDFVDMKDRGHRTEVHTVLRDTLAQAPDKSFVAPMNELGVITLTRRRQGPSLRQAVTEPCAACSGRGRVRAAWQVAGAVLEAVGFTLRQEPAETMLVNAAPAVAEILFGAAQPELAALEARTGCTVLPVARAHFGPERFELLTGARPGSVQAHLLKF